MQRTLGLWFAGLLLALAWPFPAEAQQRNFKIGGGAGFAWPKSPLFELQRGWDLGGYLGYRFNDNLSLEIGFNFIRSDRQFDVDDRPITDPRSQLAATARETTRYPLDAVLVYNLGRRQPFHPFLFAGGGYMRDDLKTTDLTPLFEAEDPTTVELETTTETSYFPIASFGGGFDFYVLFNVAARFELRMWIPPEDFDLRTWRLFASATYFF